MRLRLKPSISVSSTQEIRSSAALEESKRLGVPARLRSFSYNWAAQRLYHQLGFTTVAEKAPHTLFESERSDELVHYRI